MATPTAGNALDTCSCFYIVGNMDTTHAVRSLAALAQDSRLDVFRLLVQTGPEGLSAGDLAERVGIPDSTLSFHLKTLAHAGLIESRRVARFIYYSANFAAMNGLVGFLTDNCCGGRTCGPAALPTRKKRAQGR